MPLWYKLHHVPCVLQSTWYAASVSIWEHIMWRTCWTASLNYCLAHSSCVVHVFVLVGSHSVAWRLSYIIVLMTIMCMQLLCAWSVHLWFRSRSPHNVMYSYSILYRYVTGCVYWCRAVHDCQYQYISVDLTITLIHWYLWFPMVNKCIKHYSYLLFVYACFCRTILHDSAPMGEFRHSEVCSESNIKRE